jgi:hypothetical protein
MSRPRLLSALYSVEQANGTELATHILIFPAELRGLQKAVS